MRVNFLKSGVRSTDYPFPYRPEVAIVGRSNAGKSSFINALVDQKIARVSQTPGKTRLLNFFELNQALYMVDMPGYGFATGDRREVESWRKMIETYLAERESLKGVVLIMDIRREWSADEDLLRDWFTFNETPYAVILNKTDKLSRSAALAKRAKLAKVLEAPVFAVSSAKKHGFDDVKNLMFKEWGR